MMLPLARLRREKRGSAAAPPITRAKNPALPYLKCTHNRRRYETGIDPCLFGSLMCASFRGHGEETARAAKAT
jgi:hypothetical protein